MFYIDKVQQAVLTSHHAWINSNWVGIFVGIEVVAMLVLLGLVLWDWVDDGKGLDLGELFCVPLFISLVVLISGGASAALAHILVIAYAYTHWWGLVSLSVFIALLFVARYGRRTHKMLQAHVKDNKAHK